MELFFKCPKDIFQAPLLEAEKPVKPAIALAAVLSQAAYGTYHLKASDGSFRAIRPGQFPVSIERLMRLTGWSDAEITRFLHHLHEHGVLSREHWNGHTIATVNLEAVRDLPPFSRAHARGEV